jgi:protein arginine kinase activator
MLCDTCHKNEATVRFTQVVNQKKQVFHLCGACAENPTMTAEGISVSIKGSEIQVSSRKADVPSCFQCGMAFEEFQNGGLFGCPACYDAFASRLPRLMKRIHGVSSHRPAEPGSASLSPARVDEEETFLVEEVASALDASVAPSAVSDGELEASDTADLEGLQASLKEAVETEAFEEAAALRDRIAGLNDARSEGAVEG